MPAPIDWAVVRARLEAARRAMEEATHLPAERAALVLEERARRLAEVPPVRSADADRLEVALFSLAGERYAIETRHVRAIVRLADLTPLPGTADLFAGVTNVRGEIVAVVDLRRLLGLPASGLSDLVWMIVLGEGRPEFGVLADQVHELASLTAEGGLAPWGPAADRQGCIRGLTRDATVVLDGAALLADPRLYVVAGARP